MKKKSVCIILCTAFITMHTQINSNDTTTIHNYFWANYTNFSGNKNVAHKQYEHLLDPSTHTPIYVYKGYLHFLFDTKQYKKIIDLIPKLDKQFAHDVTIQLLFVQTLENSKKQKEADTRVIQLSKTYPTHSEIVFRSSQAYTRIQHYNEALEVIMGYLNKTPSQPNNFIFYFLLSQIYVMQHRQSEALEMVQKCLDMHPTFDKGWLCLATLKEQAGQLEDAIKGYSTFLEISGRNPEIERHLFTLTIKKNTNNTDNNSILSGKSSYESALLNYQQKQYIQANTCINNYLLQNPADTQARLLKIQILSTTKNFSKAITLISQWFEQEPGKKLWVHTLFLLIHAGVPHTKIIDVLQALEKKHPTSPWPSLYLADLAIRNKNHTQAITHLEKTLPRLTNKKLKMKTLHHIALLYLEQQNYDLMAQFLEKAYEQNNTYAPVANDLAYCITQQKNCDFQRAQKLISQALEQDKNNPLYIDTQAIIYCQQGEYARAETLLQPLNISTNPIILLNLAQIKYALHKKTEAQILTEKAAKYVTLTYEKESLKKMQDLLQQ